MTGDSSSETGFEQMVVARLAELRAQGKTLYQPFIDEDDRTDGPPELWCIVNVDTGETVQRRRSQQDLMEFPKAHPDWVDVLEVEARVREQWKEARDY